METRILPGINGVLRGELDLEMVLNTSMVLYDLEWTPGTTPTEQDVLRQARRILNDKVSDYK